MAQPISRRFAQRMSTSTHSFTLHTTPRTLRTQAPAFRAQARSQFRSYSSTKGSNPIKVWPFVAIIAAGSGAYALMVKQRAGT
jgi:UMP-CMP kinase